MDKTPFFLIALTLLAAVDNTIETLSGNLDTLAKKDSAHPDRVDITLTETERLVKFGRVFGKWGILTSNGNWTALENVPSCVLDEVAVYVQRVVNNL